MLNIALPKGRLGEKVYAMFEKAGFECPAIHEPGRKLIFENPEKGVRYFWVKPSDVAIYVERGAADIGVAGKDILLEYEPDVYELLDMDLGKCRMAVAAPASFRDNENRTLKVATKFTNIAANYYNSIGTLSQEIFDEHLPPQAAFRRTGCRKTADGSFLHCCIRPRCELRESVSCSGVRRCLPNPSLRLPHSYP